MSIQNIINVVKTYKNPLWYYFVLMKWVKNPVAKLSLRDNLQFFVRVKKNDLFVVHEVYANNVYDFALENLDPKNSTIVDVGAHIGTFSLKASLAAKQVYSYEPEKESFEFLKMNIGINNRKNISASQVGISSTAGTFPIFVSETNSSCNTMFEELSRNVQSTQSIRCVRLQDEIKKYKISKIDLLKLDCEGAEYQILMSLPKSVYDIVDRIVFEYQDIPGKNIHHKTLLKHIEKMGFSSKTIDIMNERTGTVLAWRRK